VKTCTKCAETKPLVEFRVDRQRPDGRGTWCKPCVSANTRRRFAEYRAETGERYQDRTYPLGECEDCGAPIRVRPDRKTMRCRRCAARMAGEVSGRRKKAIAATPEAQQQRRARKALDRARRRAAEIEGEDFDPLEIFERDGGR